MKVLSQGGKREELTFPKHLSESAIKLGTFAVVFSFHLPSSGIPKEEETEAQ